jgi:hypothetical protein
MIYTNKIKMETIHMLLPKDSREKTRIVKFLGREIERQELKKNCSTLEALFSLLGEYEIRLEDVIDYIELNKDLKEKIKIDIASGDNEYYKKFIDIKNNAMTDFGF